MRVRGLAAVRHAIESAPPRRHAGHGDDRRLRHPRARRSQSRADLPPSPRRRPVLVYFHGGGMVMGSNHSFEPLARTLAAPVERHRGIGGLPTRSGEPRTCTVRRRIYRHRVGCGERRATGCRRRAAGGRRRQRRWFAGRGGGAGGPGSRRSHHLLSGAALSGPRPRYGGARRSSRCPMRRCSATTTSSTCTSSPTPVAGAPHDQYRVPAYAPDLSGTAARDRRDRRMRPDPRLG